MSIQQVPGFEEQLAPALLSLAQGVNKVINPDFDFQKEMKMHLASHPELIGELANAEAKAPGTLKKLGLGPLSDTIAVTGPDAATQWDIAHRPEAVAALSAKNAADTASSNLTAGRANAGVAALQNPEVAKTTGTVVTTGQTPWEMADGAQRMKLQQMGAEIMKQDPAITFKKLTSGEYTSEQMAAIMASPMAPVIKEQLAAQQEERRMRLMERGQRSQENMMQRMVMGDAINMYTKTGVGSPAAYMKIFSDPNELSRIANLDPNTATGADKDAIAAYNGMKNISDREKVQEAMNDTKTIEAAVAAYHELDSKKFNSSADEDAERSAITAGLNGYLAKRAAMQNGPHYTASYEKLNNAWYQFGDRKGLVFKDAQGNPVDPKLAIQGQPTLNMQASPEQRSLANAVIAKYKQLGSTPAGKTERDLSLQKLQTTNPAVYNLVRERLDTGN